MTSSPVPQPERLPLPLKAPSKGAIAAAVGGGVAAVGGLLTLLWLLIDGSDPQAPAQLELVRIGTTVLLGAGGLFGLYIAWRRQRSAEISLQQKQQDQIDVARAYALQERTALASEADAAARRITDLYTKAVEQLGSDKAPVRFGGLYALERLAQDHLDQRQTIVNVLCAYLRMPYPLPDIPPNPEDNTNPEAHREQIGEHRDRTQEREVRLTAQHILAHHRKPGPTYWETTIDLTGADFTGANLTGANLTGANLTRANLTDADLTHANPPTLGRVWAERSYRRRLYYDQQKPDSSGSLAGP